ncbi:MAG TPA: glycoside hydrolase family 127 protein [Candidatus Blautia stercoravium]|nr:glycoside hydrolase family 127 protein [Candidatus Blautia stercoravium]
MERVKLESIPLHAVHIQDSFWDKYIRLVKDVILPYQWDTLNDRVEGAQPSHCIKNFKIAAGEETGEFQGAVFQDTDVAKWLEAVAFTLASSGRDEKLEKLADETIALIGRAQCEDGYLNTYYTIQEPDRRWTNLKEGHELYTAGHMIEAAVAYYQATGKKEFLEIVSRFADVICKKFGPKEGQCHGYPGHPEVELALVKLYRVTKEKKYLDTAKFFIDARGQGENYFEEEEKGEKYKQIFPEFAGYQPEYSQSHLPVREQKTAEGHAVRAVYLYSAMADLAYEYQDKELEKACETLWNNMVQKRMYITGGIGSSGLLERFTTDYDLPNDRNYSESCASIGLAMFGKRMGDMTRDASYADIVEKALYNTVLAGISMDGKSFFYVNPLEVWPDNCLERTSLEHVKPVRQKWFGVACCPPNIARTLASLGQYLYGKDEKTLYFNLYVSNETEVEIKEKPYKIKVDSNYLTDGIVKILAESRKASENKAGGKIALRIPGYMKKFRIYRNGEKLENPIIKKGYLFLENLGEREEITLEFEIKTRFVRANPQVRADEGRVAVMRGPLVYCLEEMDNGKNLSSCYIDTQADPEELYEPNLLGGVVSVKLKGKRISTKGWEDGSLYSEQETVLEDTELKAVPYCNWGNRKTGEMAVWIKELIKN